MKQLLSFLFVGIFFQGFTQEFKTTAESAKFYKASYYGATRDGVITADGLLIHASEDGIEIIDLKTGQTIYAWDPTGSGGETWISLDGKFAGNYGQNGEDANGNFGSVFHVLDLTTKKVYSKIIPLGGWTRGAFGPSANEVVVSTSDAETSTSTILLFDFIKGEPIKTFFSSTKFSTVIMDLAFSKDGSKIYAGIAENTTNSYLNVYDKKTGTVLKKVQLTYQFDKIFVSDSSIFVSGFEGNSGKPHTTKLSSIDYTKKGEWNFRIENMDPTGKYCLMRDYNPDFSQSNYLSRFDLNTGVKTDLVDISSLGQFGNVNAISPGGKYFFYSIKREGKILDQAGKNAMIVFVNTLIVEETTDETMEVIIEPLPIPVEEVKWFTHNSTKPKFKINFPSTPEITTGTTSKGSFTQTIKHEVSKDVVYMVSLVELSSKTKVTSYAKVADDMALAFVNKIGVTESKKTQFTCNGQTGTEYTFTKGAVFYRYRAICLNGYAYQLIYLNSEKIPQTGDEFFNSFSVE